MNKTIFLILGILLAQPSFARDKESNVVTPLWMTSGYFNLPKYQPKPENLIGKWKWIGGADGSDSLKTSAYSQVGHTLEFKIWDAYPTKLNLVIEREKSTETFYGVYFIEQSTFRTFLSNTSKATIVVDKQAKEVETPLKDCTSLSNIYLVCRTDSSGDDWSYDTFEVYQRELPPTPIVKSFYELEKAGYVK